MKTLINIRSGIPDGKLYKNQYLNRIEALIPSREASCHAADLQELPNGDILCVWFGGSEEGNGDISIFMSRLKSESSVWSEPVRITQDETRSEQNPSLFLHPDDTLYLIYTSQAGKEPDVNSNVFNLQYTSGIQYKTSKDNGYTWSEPLIMFDAKGSFCRQKIQILSSGRWIFGNWICYPDSTRNGSDIPVIQISDNQGKTWRAVDIPNGRGKVHGNIIEMDNGKLLAFFRSRAADYIYKSVSYDYGEHWEVPIRTVLPNNNSSISAVRISGKRVAVIYNHFQANENPELTVWPYERCPIAIAVSEDEGITWPYKRYVEIGEGFFGTRNLKSNRRYEYPVIMQDKDGFLHIAYSYGNRSCIRYMMIDESWITGNSDSLSNWMERNKYPLMDSIN